MLYPGLGLGCIAVKASQITDGMFAAAARAVADLVTDNKEGSPILPLVDDMRYVSRTVAIAVAKQAIDEGVARKKPDNLEKQITEAMWEPQFAQYKAV
jgi:malate dehydrogenase (oxaloacetate-decarboxylating)